MRILEKDLNKVEVKTETDDYKENFNSELIWKDEVDIKINNIFIQVELVMKTELDHYLEQAVEEETEPLL